MDNLAEVFIIKILYFWFNAKQPFKPSLNLEKYQFRLKYYYKNKIWWDIIWIKSYNKTRAKISSKKKAKKLCDKVNL